MAKKILNQRQESESMDFNSDDSIADPICNPLEYNEKNCRKRKDISDECSSTSRKAKNYVEKETDLFNSIDAEKSSSETSEMFFTQSSKFNAENKLLFSENYFTIIEYLNNSKFQKDRNGLVTSNFLKHLKCVHPSIHKKYLASMLGNKKKVKPFTTLQDNLDNMIIDFIAETMSPISIIKKKTFIDLIDFGHKNLNVMKRQKAVNLIDKKYISLMNNIKEKMSNINHFCTTADIWSCKTRSFFGYTCHWIDNDFKRYSVALACRRFASAHTYNRICDLMYEINEQFGLNHRNTTATVTDNGSNFVKSFKEFGIEAPHQCLIEDQDTLQDLDDENEDISDDIELPEFEENIHNVCKTLPKHQRCATHTINLLATTDFTDILKKNGTLYVSHKNIIRKCSYLWNKSHRPKSSELIIKILGISLTYPVVTRWNSLYNSIIKMLSVKDKLNNLCTQFSLPKFSKTDFSYLEEYCTLMCPISEILNFLQNEKHMFYGYLMPSLVTLQTKLRKLYSSTKLTTLNNVAMSLEKCLTERFQKYFSLSPDVRDAIVASVLCPAVKLRCLNVLKKNAGNYTIHDCDIHSIFSNYANRLKDENDVPGVDKNKSNVINFFDYDEDSTDFVNGDIHDTFDAEYHLYLADPGLDVEIINKYPTMKKIFLYVNTTLASSAPVERLFSFAGIVNSPRRHKLSDSNFEKLVLMRV